LVALANAAAAPASMKDLRVTKVASLSSLLRATSQAGQARCQEWPAAALSSANGVLASCPPGQLELTARGLPVFRRGSLHVAGRARGYPADTVARPVSNRVGWQGRLPNRATPGALPEDRRKLMRMFGRRKRRVGGSRLRASSMDAQLTARLLQEMLDLYCHPAEPGDLPLLLEKLRAR
jgi:hypothetical protein